MTSPISFVCPSCGAPLTAQPGELEIQCKFCGNTVLVPTELQPKAPPVQPAPPPPIAAPEVIFVEQQPRVIYEQVPGAPLPPRRRRGCGCGCGCIGPLLVLIFALGLGAGLLYVNEPVLFARILAQVQPLLESYSNTPQVIVFAASPKTLTSGDSVVVVWVTNAPGVSLQEASTKTTQTLPSLSGAGEHTFAITNETGQITFRLTVTKNGQSLTRTETVTVRR